MTRLQRHRKRWRFLCVLRPKRVNGSACRPFSAQHPIAEPMPCRQRTRVELPVQVAGVCSAVQHPRSQHGRQSWLSVRQGIGTAGGDQCHAAGGCHVGVVDYLHRHRTDGDADNRGGSAAAQFASDHTAGAGCTNRLACGCRRTAVLERQPGDLAATPVQVDRADAGNRRTSAELRIAASGDAEYAGVASVLAAAKNAQVQRIAFVQ